MDRVRPFPSPSPYTSAAADDVCRLQCEIWRKEKGKEKEKEKDKDKDKEKEKDERA